MRNSSKPTALSIWLTCLCTLLVLSSSGTTVVLSRQEGRVVRDRVHGSSLEQTMTGESPERAVAVYLPPSYDTALNKKYPVIYLLHGFGDGDWPKSWPTIEQVMNNGITERKFGEMIVVMPDESTKAGGSFYTNSPVTGNWEDFTTKDLVSYIDRNYRTLGQASSRGIAGYSMGGYGALKLGMKHPETYSAVYAMNPGVLGWAADLSIENPAFASVLKIKSDDDVLKARGFHYEPAIISAAQAFSPNPGRPPFFVDFPFEMVKGKLQPAQPAFSKWEENFPLNMVERYKASLLKLRGIRFDSAYEDEFTHIPITSRRLSAALTKLGVAHTFEEYHGNHHGGITERLYARVLPYFGSLLEAK